MKYLGVATVAFLFSSTLVLADEDTDRLVGAMLGDTPIISDLRSLTDEIGGRVTGSAANSASVDWALERFAAAKVAAHAEAFEMPNQWQELAVSVEIEGDISFSPKIVAKPFSASADGLSAPLVDAGFGSDADFLRLGETAKDAWVLIETKVLNDEIGLGGLFAEYADAASVELKASDAGAAGIVFMSSRPNNLLYRLPLMSSSDPRPFLTMERESALRALRLIREGKQLSLTATVSLDHGYAYQSANVIAEIPGRSRPDEIIVMGAHLDSHDLGTGALDNGSNAVMMIDIARQIRRLNLQPERTIRFALWNGEEQGLVGSWRYTQQHADELDKHIVAASFDIGTGRILGFFTGGMRGLGPMVDEYLVPVAGLGPFTQVDIPLVGTDNFDFMMQGVPNLIAMQADANYASNYHASSDTFEKVDQQQLKLNSAIAAAMVWGFANSDDRLPRHTAAQINELIKNTDLEQQMRNFGVWRDWENGDRGRHR